MEAVRTAVPEQVAPRVGGASTAFGAGWGPDLLAGAGVLVLGGLEVAARGGLVGDRAEALLVVVLLAAAVGGARRLPSAGLAVVWLVGLLHLVLSTPVLATEAVVLVVAFATARWGRVPTVLLGALSIPAGVAVIGAALTSGYYPRGYADTALLRELSGTLELLGGVGVAGVVVLPLSVLGTAWLAGLALRFLERAASSRRHQTAAEEAEAAARLETEQAYEIARLRLDQARLARDVHDVVGHSLAVILAQAESGQYLPDDDPARLKQVLATIAGSARGSLHDVRHVLDADGRPQRVHELDQLVEGARDTGQPVDATVSGDPRPLPPELGAVAYRVLQEMLTNALRHGRRDVPLRIEQRWPQPPASELVLQVHNAVTAPTGGEKALDAGGSGRGLEGMRRRLEAVGGHLSVTTDPAGGSFTATARMPVRG